MSPKTRKIKQKQKTKKMQLVGSGIRRKGGVRGMVDMFRGVGVCVPFMTNKLWFSGCNYLFNLPVIYFFTDVWYYFAILFSLFYKFFFQARLHPSGKK